MNRLAQATSPYLRQHADNPVNWQPWDDEALQQARDEDRVILLSIGYSACHWCHVMAHESFASPQVAAVMNDNFVNIKVDREERPDLDRIYQATHQLMTRRPGGWPLTVFLTPDQHLPIFCGTYFPPEARAGMPGFVDLMERVARVYREQTDEVRQQSAGLLTTLKRMSQSESVEADAIGPAPLHQAIQFYRQQFDPVHGGFTAAPKFPHAMTLERLLRHHQATLGHSQHQDSDLEMALFTLRCMANGGLFDHLGGGFFRYSVDAEWSIPHFEKMLYDNGPLLSVYTRAWQLSGDCELRQAAIATADWALRDMQSAEGAFWSSLDADSEGEEGRYYVWERTEIDTLLDDPVRSLFYQRYGMNGEANFEGHWHLQVTESLDSIARQQETDRESLEQLLERARLNLFHQREKRSRPGLDDKVLTSWNALMIRGLAEAAMALNRPQYLLAAQRACDYLRQVHWQDGRLLASSYQGKARLNAYLDDHAFLLDALLYLLQAEWRPDYLHFASQLAEALLDLFLDQDGAFSFTARDHESLLPARKPMQDDSLPSGNGIAAHALLRLGHLLAEPRYLQTAETVLQAAWQDLSGWPAAHNALLLALEEYLRPPDLILLRGPEQETRRWLKYQQQACRPRQLAFYLPPESDEELPAILQQENQPQQPTAWICSGHQCAPPITDFERYRQLVDAGGA